MKKRPPVDMAPERREEVKEANC